jgi:5,6-dimethylbenzimidazole synthase
MLDQGQLLELVKKRRSVRGFKPDDVPDELIEKILEVARWAPSGANSQPWGFLVIKDKAVKERVAAVVLDALRMIQRMEQTRPEGAQHPNAHRDPGGFGFKDAPVFVIVMGDPRARAAQVLAAQQYDHSYISGLANSFLYMHLAATSLGLGSQWLSASSLPFCQPFLKRELGIPEKLDIFEMFVLGYPAVEPKPRQVRELDGMVHRDRYDMAKHRSDDQVKEFCRQMQLGR